MVELGYGMGTGTGSESGGTDCAVNALALKEPCLPARSPTWHCCGVDGSQGGFSPLFSGSRCGPAPVQFPSAGTGSAWMW